MTRFKNTLKRALSLVLVSLIGLQSVPVFAGQTDNDTAFGSSGASVGQWDWTINSGNGGYLYTPTA